jgi:starch phosphorylase
MFFNRDVNGIPREWIKRMRHSMATLVSQFTTDRMVKEYTNKYYGFSRKIHQAPPSPAAGLFARLKPIPSIRP